MNRLTVHVLIFAILAVSACSDHGTGPEPNLRHEPDGMVLSNPVSAASLANQIRVRQSISSSSDGTVAYVSIAPGTYPTAFEAEIRNRNQSDVAMSVPVTDGGFDPVTISAREGDMLRLTIWARVGGPTILNLKVPARRPPTVVRSNPPKGRVDVALNQYLVAVFSEPIDPRSVTASSVRVERNGQRVAGIVRFDDNSWTAEFIPDRPFEPQSSYELIITEDIRDLDGDGLETSYTAPFSTDKTECPGYAIPSSCPPFPTGGSHTIIGVVNERTAEGLRPIADATVFAWVQTPTFGYSRGGVRTDAAGHYRIDLLPAGLIHLQVGALGMDQPCGKVLELSAPEATADLEVVEQGHPVYEAATAPPVVTGVVYEKVGTARIPLPGARIFFETSFDLVSATTTTDDNGRYAMCSLPSLMSPQLVTALKEGYTMQSQGVFVESAARTEMDFELSR